jgi:antitoxin (DNA-binding transcriptional repressor) of toxin-antitoxin stability system
VSEKEIGVEEARKTLGSLVDDAALEGAVTYLTRRGRRYAAIVPLDRIKETAVTETTYTRTTDEGTEAVKVIRDGEEVREIYTVDGDVCDDSVVCSDDADSYLRGRETELRADGYTAA